jgi:ABC-type sugar transport system ATPase subunit
VRGASVVLDDLDLDIAPGERFVLLGASGAGKTTFLRVLAGLEPVASGAVWFGEREVTHVPPRDRGLGMVSQESTLQPHRDVRGNLAFPLEIRAVPPEERRLRVEAEARAFSLRDLLRRRPETLSAGKQHEVALARSLVRQVEVLLVDEPFAHLDAARRVTLQRELFEVQAGYGLTLVIATNDQRVAMTCGERVAVLHRGRIAQVGAPMELYRTPRTRFVAEAVGEPSMDVYRGNARHTDAGTVLEAGPLEVRTSVPELRTMAGRGIEVGIRPNAWRETGADPHAGRRLRVAGDVVQREFLGPSVSIGLDVRGHRVHAVVPRPGPALGAAVTMAADPRDVHVFDAADGRVVSHGV